LVIKEYTYLPNQMTRLNIIVNYESWVKDLISSIQCMFRNKTKTTKQEFIL